MNDILILTAQRLLLAFVAILILIGFFVLLGIIPDADTAADAAARYWGRAV